MWRSRRRSHWVLALVLCLLWGTAWIGTRPLADPDEGRYAEISRVMVISQDWLTPQLDGRDHLSKPPITYWITALGMLGLGFDAWGARIGVGLTFGLWLFVVLRIGAVRGASRLDLFCIAVVHGTSLLPFIGGNLLTTDPFLSSAMGAASLFAVAAMVDASKRQWTIRGFWLASAVAFLIKGPPALLLVPALLICWRARLDPAAGERILLRPVVVVAACVAASWYLIMVVQEPERWKIFLLEEVVGRVSSSAMRRNAPFWLPALTLALGTLPWGLVALFGARSWSLPSGGRRGSETDGASQMDRRAVSTLFLGAWLITSLLVFTLSTSRMYLYVLPVSSVLSLWIGEGISSWIRGRRGRQGFCALLALSAIAACLALRIAGEDLPGYRSSEPLARQIQALSGANGAPVVFVGIASAPGLDFALQERLPRVAIGKSDRAHAHDFDRASLIDLVRGRGKVLGVGTMPDLRRVAGFLEVEIRPAVEGTALRAAWLLPPTGKASGFAPSQASSIAR